MQREERGFENIKREKFIQYENEKREAEALEIEKTEA